MELAFFRNLFVFSRAARSHKKHVFVLWGLGKEKEKIWVPILEKKTPEKIRGPWIQIRSKHPKFSLIGKTK